MRSHMIRAGALAATLLAPLALTAPLAQTAPAGASASATAARVIVKYRADSAIARLPAQSAVARPSVQAQALGRRLGLALRAGRALGDRSHVVMAAGLTSRELAARLSSESDVEYAVPDQRMHIVAAPNDVFYATRAIGATSGGPVVGQWYLKPPGAAGAATNTAPAAINAEQAWDTTVGSASIVVAVLDTGVRFDHPDLQGGNVLAGYDMISADSDGSFSTANDTNGRDSDASDPGDWITAAEANNKTGLFYQCGPTDSNGNYVGENSTWHGTQTLGLIGAATNNNVGIASVGRTVTMLPVRVLGKCGGFTSDITAAMMWSVGIDIGGGVPQNTTHKARVLNLSLGGSGACSAAYADAVSQVTAAGAVVVVAAGNGNGRAVGSPANCNGVVAVAGLRHVGDKVGYSDIGHEVTLAAPAGNCVSASGACLYPIMTTANSGTTTPVADSAGGSIYTDSFNASLGTSFSAPLVAGAAALMLSANPSLTPADVKARLAATARAFPTTGGTAGIPQCMDPATLTTPADQDECYCVTGVCGSGMLDVHAAVLAAIATGGQAGIAVTTSAPTAGQPVAFSGSTSTASSGHSIVSYQWAITSGGGIATGFVNGTSTGATVSIVPSAAGTFSVSLTTTDDIAVTSTASTTITVAAAPVVVTPPASTPTSSSSGGGGAVGVGWLALLLAAVLALARAQRRDAARARRLARVSVGSSAPRRG